MVRRPLLLVLVASAACSQPAPQACTADGHPLDDGPLAGCTAGPGLIAYAFTPQGGAIPSLFLVRPDGTCHRRVTADGAYYGAPAFFPGGTRMAYASTRAGLNSIYTLDLTTGVETTIATQYDFGSGSIGLQTLAAAAPSISPDGRTIAFEGSVPAYSPWSDVFTVPAAGGNVVRLTSSNASTIPAWSKDGALVYYVSYPAGPPELFSVPPDGSLAATQLTTGSGLSSKFSVSGDGGALLYARFSATGSGTRPTELVELDLATSGVRVISSADEADPASDAADATVAVSRRSTTGYDLYLLDYASGAVRQQLTACPGQAFGAAVAR